MRHQHLVNLTIQQKDNSKWSLSITERDFFYFVAKTRDDGGRDYIVKKVHLRRMGVRYSDQNNLF